MDDHVSQLPGAPPMGEPYGIDLRIRTSAPAELDRATVEAWADLEQRALDCNAYLSPHFVLPAAKYLKPDSPAVVVVLIEARGRGTCDLVGVGVFVDSRPTKRFPLPHLRAFQSRHSFLSGLLVDEDYAEQVISAFLQFFCRPESVWHGVEFRALAGNGLFSGMLHDAAAQHEVLWFEYGREERAILVPSLAGERYVKEELPNERRKDAQRRMRRLQEQGDVKWRAVAGADVSDEHVESFLDLEHRGWKGQDGTSLRSRATDEAFFREMIGGFRKKGKVVFTELCLAGRPIASTVNLSSGTAGFAFKLGWDPAHAKMAPGVLNEVELIRHAPELFHGIEYLDSGAAPGSFMEDLWVKRRELVAGAFAVTPLARKVLYTLQQASRLKQSLSAFKRRLFSLGAVFASLWSLLSATLQDPS